MKERWTGQGRKELLINGKWVAKARVIMERELGRTLSSDEVVHHTNGDVSDDRPENLEVMTNAEHVALHNPSELARREKRHLRFGSQALENNPNWKGEEATAHAKYMRKWRRRTGEVREA